MLIGSLMSVGLCSFLCVLLIYNQQQFITKLILALTAQQFRNTVCNIFFVKYRLNILYKLNI